MGVGESARGLVEAASGEEEKAQTLAGDGVTGSGLEGHAVSRLGLGVPPLTEERSRERYVRVGQRGRDVGGRAERRFLLVEPTLPPIHEPEAQVSEGVAWLEAHRLAIGRAGLRPQALPLQGEPELEMSLDRARGQIERGAQGGHGLWPPALLEEQSAQIQVGGRRAGPRPRHFLELRERFVGAMLAAEGGAEQRAELHIARSAGEAAAAYGLGFGRPSVGESGLGPPERGGGPRGGAGKTALRGQSARPRRRCRCEASRAWHPRRSRRRWSSLPGSPRAARLPE